MSSAADTYSLNQRLCEVANPKHEVNQVDGDGLPTQASLQHRNKGLKASQAPQTSKRRSAEGGLKRELERFKRLFKAGYDLHAVKAGEAR